MATGVALPALLPLAPEQPAKALVTYINPGQSCLDGYAAPIDKQLMPIRQASAVFGGEITNVLHSSLSVEMEEAPREAAHRLRRWRRHHWRWILGSEHLSN